MLRMFTGEPVEVCFFFFYCSVVEIKAELKRLLNIVLALVLNPPIC